MTVGADYIEKTIYNLDRDVHTRKIIQLKFLLENEYLKAEKFDSHITAFHLHFK